MPVFLVCAERRAFAPVVSPACAPDGSGLGLGAVHQDLFEVRTFYIFPYWV